MPAAVMLPKATLFLDVLPKLHQGAAATSASSHDAVKITIAKLGVVGCVAQGEAGAISCEATPTASNVAVGAVEAADSIPVCESLFTHCVMGSSRYDNNIILLIFFCVVRDFERSYIA